MTQSRCHHFIPRFYLKRWSRDNTDRKLASGKYCKITNSVKWSSCAPRGTSYELGLYGDIEEKFFSPLDNDACNVLNSFESGHSEKIVPVKLDLREKDRERWAEFILGFIIRRPDKVKFLQAAFQNRGLDADTAINNLPNIIRNKNAIRDLRSLKWIFAKVNTNLEIITSDNPLIFKPDNLEHPNCVIILPTSPKLFFLATKQENIERLEKDPRKMVKYINAEVIKNAKERIYAKSSNSIEDNFIMKNWLKKGLAN